MDYIGLNPLKIKGPKDESYGYSKHVNIKINNKNYTPVISALINPWGFKTPKEAHFNNKGTIKELDKYLLISNETKDVDINGFIAGYNSIIIGNRLWTPKSGFNLGKISDYKSIITKIKWIYKTKGPSNFAFDIWLTKKKEGPLGEEDIELMIWLDYNFDTPYKVNKETNEFKIKYIKKQAVNYLPSYHWFILLNKNKKGIIKFDLIELFKECMKIKPLGDYYIRAIELGNEYSKNTKVSTKILKAELNFTKNI